MSEAESFHAEVEWLGWEKPAIESVADFLTTQLSEKELARATVVVPTAESSRMLKEYMAERLSRPVLMPRMVQPGNLVPPMNTANVATETDTLAVWLTVMSRVAEEVMADENGVWFDLFPKAPVGDSAPWVMNMAQRLMHLRKQMEQECLTDTYADLLQGYAPDFTAKRAEEWKRFVARMGARWDAARRIFRMVDEELRRQGLCPREEAMAEAVQHPHLLRSKSLLVLACVPEISPLNELFIRRAVASGQRRLCVLVNAPESEAAWFDAFGRPLVRDAAGKRVARWLEDAVPLHMDEEGRPMVTDGKAFIHQAANAEEMGAKAVALAAGKAPHEVCVAVCDNAMAPAVQAAFLQGGGTPWCLNLPAGRSAAATQEGALAVQLAEALQVPHRLPLYDESTGRIENNEPNLLEPLRALLSNGIMQRCFELSAAETGKEAVLSSFDAALDEVFRTAYPSHMRDLVRCFTPHNATEEQKAAGLTAQRYVRFVCRLVQDGSGTPEEMASALRKLGRLLAKARHTAGGSLLAEPLCRLAAFAEQHGAEYSESVLQQLLQDTLKEGTKKKIPFLHREETHGDVVGWNELTYSRASNIILCGMHDDCVPARPLTDIFLPDALRCSVGITSSESRTARDAFLLTALLHSRPNRVRFIVARSRADGTPPAPSSLLLRCGKNHAELAERAAYLFREPEEIARRKEYRHWNLLRAPEMSKEQMGTLADLRRADGTAIENPFATNAPLSPSLLNTFLNCPLRFWLQYACGLNPSDAYPEDLSELKGNLYGDLMHEVLRRFTEQYDTADKLPEGNEDAQLECLRAEIDRLTDSQYRRYGDTSRALLLVQKEQMKAALHDFARCHREDLLQGWCVMWREEKVNYNLQQTDGTPVPLTMRIDRVDRNVHTGQWRIIDYKSNDKAPDKAHYATFDEAVSPLQNTVLAPCVFSEQHTLADGTKKDHFFRITNVQLPLYATALRQLCEEKGEPFSYPLLGYYNIPRGKAEAAFNLLHTKEKPQQNTIEKYEELFHTVVCTVAALIRSGSCLYSAESLGFKSPTSSFGALTPDDDPRTLCGMKAEFNA